MKIIQKLLRNISLGIPSPRSQRPLLDTPEKWCAYWETQGQSWRREPAIDLQRQAELVQKRALAVEATKPTRERAGLLSTQEDPLPEARKRIDPFKDVKLNRADVEWLLATHESGQGPVTWHDISWGHTRQRERQGLDLRGADLEGVDLSDLPLARLRAEGAHFFRAHLERAELAEAHLEEAHFGQAHLEKTFLFRAHLEGAYLDAAHLEGSDLGATHLEGASFRLAHLKGSDLGAAHLEGSDFWWANLEEVNLEEAHLAGANFTGACLKGAFLKDIILSDEDGSSPKLADVQWGETNLALVNWSQMARLGDEQEARERQADFYTRKEIRRRLEEYQAAVRANRQLGVALQAQGLNEEAARFIYRAQTLQKTVFRLQMLQSGIRLRQRLQALGAWLFSWFLDLLAGYGYKPGRSLLAYLLVIMGFTALYLGLDGHLAWYEAVVVSMAAFHGRGFSPSTFSPGDPLSIASAFEAFVGLIIEVTFIATLTQRFFSK